MNTHLNADPIFGYKNKAINIRQKQLDHIRSIIRRKKRNNINNVILCGDFNIDYNDIELIKPIMNTYRYSIINQKKLITYSEEKTQLDYIIVLYQTKNKNNPKYKRYINTKLSDHYMIGLEL